MASLSSAPVTGSIKFHQRTRPPFNVFSNLHPCRLVEDGPMTTVEHEYQARKFEVVFSDSRRAAMIRSAPHGKAAKALGSERSTVAYWQSYRSEAQANLHMEFKQRVEADWHPHRLSNMKHLLLQKFDRVLNPALYTTLMSTGDIPLHHGGRADFWTQSGDDKLGKLLVEIRSHFRAQEFRRAERIRREAEVRRVQEVRLEQKMNRCAQGLRRALGTDSGSSDSGSSDSSSGDPCQLPQAKRQRTERKPRVVLLRVTIIGEEETYFELHFVPVKVGACLRDLDDKALNDGFQGFRIENYDIIDGGLDPKEKQVWNILQRNYAAPKGAFVVDFVKSVVIIDA